MDNLFTTERPGIGVVLIYMAVEGVVFFIVTLLIEVNVRGEGRGKMRRREGKGGGERSSQVCTCTCTYACTVHCCRA